MRRSFGLRVFSRALPFAIFLATTAGAFATAHATALQCAQAIGAEKRAEQTVDLKALSPFPVAQDVTRELLRFADAHHLPRRLVEVGPDARRVKRLVVAVDVTNEALVREYIATFNLHHTVGGTETKTLALEFQKEVTGKYVFGALRTGDRPDVHEGLWRWGKQDAEDYTNWFVNSPIDPETNFTAFGHLIGVSPAEAKNVEYYLAHPDERAKCKSDNCIAWTTGIELGQTAKGLDDDDRRPLFTELGISRSIAHFEIARRLMHAANDRHVAVVAFVHGEKGLRTFREKTDILPPEPQIPLSDVIRGLRLDPKSPVMQAMNTLPDGAKVFVPIAAGASPEGVAALIEKASQTQKGFDVHILINGVSEAVLKKGIASSDGKFRVHSLFLGGNLRQLNREGKIDVIPGYLSDFTRFVADPEQPDFHYDAMIVRVSPPDAAGRYSLGPNNDMIMTILRNRPGIKIIAEVNPNVPFSTGENVLREDQITAKFPSQAALAGPPVLPLSEAEKQIGRNLGAVVDDGAVLQIGIGNIFGGLPDGLQAAGKSHLRIFTEMFGDPLKEVMERGIADSAETGFAFGSSDLYKWLDHNPKVKLVETEYVNSPGTVAATPRFHAINTALQVTLRGDVNATHGADGGRISSPGGQVEFMSGASRSTGGKAIIAIRSTAKGGELSSITLDTYGGNVTTPHESVTHVVTEYGVAVLRGRSESQRAVAMIGVAHPKFRRALADQALARGLISATERKALEPVVSVAAAPEAGH